MTIIRYYCRRCDLSFCEAHKDQHPDLPGHELLPNDLVEFCSVCVGIYRHVQPQEEEGA